MARHLPIKPNRQFYFLVFTVSGFAGLMYESIWTHYIKLFLGHAAYAQTLVLSIFMGGMALGAWLASRYSARWRSLMLGYALVEGAVGIAALIFHRVFVAATDATYNEILPHLANPAVAHAFKWALAAAFILPQSVLLGMTFPLMTGGIIRRFPQLPGESLSMLYFTNSLGAALGVLASGFVLVKMVGLPGTMMTAGMMNLSLALIVWLVSKDQPEPGPAVSAPGNEPASTAGPWLRGMLVAAFLTGAASFVYEIAWIRGLSLVLGGATHSFELMLSAFILGLALGGLWIRRRIERVESLPRFLGWMQVLMGAFALATLPLFNSVFELMSFVLEALARTEQGYQLFNLSSHAICLLIMLPATFCAGTTLPLMTYVLFRKGFGERSIGAIYSANTVGAIAGVLVAVHVLMPALGLKGAILVGAAADMVLGIALLFAASGRAWRGAHAPAALAVTIAAMVVTLSAVQLDSRRLLSGVYRHGHAELPADYQVVYHRDGKTATIGLMRTPDGILSISTNGKTDAGLYMGDKKDQFHPDESTMVLAGALALASHPNGKTIANIGMGSGLTTHTLLSSSQPERVDTVEIERFMVEAAKGFGPRVERAFADPRSHIYIEDAKTFFSTRNLRYDIIISEPSNPWVSGVSSLFSSEFYARIVNHLEPDGLLVQWLQLYETDQNVLASIIKALSPNFEDYVVYNSNDSDILILAKKKGLVPPLSEAALADPGLAKELARIRVLGSVDLYARLLGSKRTLDTFFASFSVPANSDYFPYVDQNAARLRFMSGKVELSALTVHSLPLLEMLQGASYAPTGTNLTYSEWLVRSHAVASAQAMRKVLLERRYGDAPRQIDQLALLPHLFVDACAGGNSEELWIDAIVDLGGFITPYLTAQELEPVWQRLERERCFAKLTARQREWYELVKAVGRRDAPQMAALAAGLLKSGAAKGSRVRLRYATLAGMLGNIVRGRPGEAFLVWARHGQEIIPLDTPPADARLLLSLTLPESKFRTALSEHPGK